MLSNEASTWKNARLYAMCGSVLVLAVVLLGTSLSPRGNEAAKLLQNAVQVKVDAGTTYAIKKRNACGAGNRYLGFPGGSAGIVTGKTDEAEVEVSGTQLLTIRSVKYNKYLSVSSSGAVSAVSSVTSNDQRFLLLNSVLDSTNENFLFSVGAGKFLQLDWTGGVIAAAGTVNNCQAKSYLETVVRTCTGLSDKDLPGNDIGFENGLTVSECQDKCKTTAGCKCYTSFGSKCWVKDGSCSNFAFKSAHTSGVCTIS